MCNLETGGTQDCRVISHKRFQTTTCQKCIHNMLTVDISETKTRQMEREFTKLCLEPQHWWVWGRLRQSDRSCILFALAAYGWSCSSIFVPTLKNIEPQFACKFRQWSSISGLFIALFNGIFTELVVDVFLCSQSLPLRWFIFNIITASLPFFKIIYF